MSHNNKKYAWQASLANLITDPLELCELLELNPNQLPLNLFDQQFSLKVPRSYVARIQKNNPSDPLLKQVLPIQSELLDVYGYTADPLEENAVNPLPGLLHKYKNRVLIMATGACAIHCRYCFRRHFPYSDNNPGKEGWQKIIAYLKSDPNIHEVILSGGDPLILPEKNLYAITEELRNIPAIKRLRMHSRIPIVLPERMTQEFKTWVEQLPWKFILVVHVNHQQEINSEVKDAMLALQMPHVILLNQSVLLKGINDTVPDLVNLSEKLFSAGVLPYYLHLLDKIQGAAHFDIDIQHAHYLHAEIKKYLPGYLVPKLAYENPASSSKIFFD